MAFVLFVSRHSLLQLTTLGVGSCHRLKRPTNTRRIQRVSIKIGRSNVLIVPRILSGRRVNRCSFMTRGSRTNPNVASPASRLKMSDWPQSLLRSPQEFGSGSRSPSSALSAGNKRLFRFIRHRDVQFIAAPAFLPDARLVLKQRKPNFHFGLFFKVIRNTSFYHSLPEQQRPF